MRRSIKMAAIGAIAAAGMLGGTAAAVVPATAATAPPPSPAAFKGYEGAQVSSGLAIDVKGRAAVAGSPVIAWQYSAADPAVRFLWVRPWPVANPDPQVKVAFYAPTGVPTNLVMTQVGSNILLEPYTGAASQLWTSSTYITPFGSTWQNLGSGNYIRQTGNGLPLSLIGAVPWKQISFTYTPIGG